MKCLVLNNVLNWSCSDEIFPIDFFQSKRKKELSVNQKIFVMKGYLVLFSRIQKKVHLRKTIKD